MTTHTSEQPSVPFWRDERVLNVLGQVVVVAAVAGFLYYLYSNLLAGLAAQGLRPGFRFLSQTAGFDIGESLLSYSRSSTVLRALQVGLTNTLRVAFLGILLATVTGTIIGVARLSSNWLVNKLAAVYVEFVRNVPLLVLLIFISTGVFFKLPQVQNAIPLPGPIYLTNRGFFVPWPVPDSGWEAYRLVLLAAIVIALIAGLLLRRQGLRTGRMPLLVAWVPLTFLAVAALGWFITPGVPLVMSIPALDGRNFQGGNGLTPEFMAILSGLVIYTTAFIAEIVRAGIQSVSKGQREAATAVGLSSFQTLRLVIFPQAMRVIVPPLTSQYLNLTKNSSLAIAVGYPDLFAVGNTVLNQTGRALEVITIAMVVYLSFSLITSLFMNWYNRRIRLVER